MTAADQRTDFPTPTPGGTAQLAGRTVARIGFGAMQLEQRAVGRDTALAILRLAIREGVNHIDTAHFYGPCNTFIHDALAPYPDGLVLVSKVGADRDADGKLVTESLRDYSKRAVTNQFASLDSFLQRWNAADRKQAIIDELEEEGLRLEPLAEEVNPDLDPFDLICHVAYGRPALTRRERADNVRKRDVFGKYGPQARAVLDALLQKYQDEGIVDLGDPRMLQIPPIDKIGTPVELIRQFGSRAGFERAVHELQDALYEVA